MYLMIGCLYLILISLFSFLLIEGFSYLYAFCKNYKYEKEKRKALNRIMQCADIYSDFCMCKYCKECIRIIEKSKNEEVIVSTCNTLRQSNPKEKGTIRYCNEFDIDLNKVYIP